MPATVPLLLGALAGFWPAAAGVSAWRRGHRAAGAAGAAATLALFAAAGAFVPVGPPRPEPFYAALLFLLGALALGKTAQLRRAPRDLDWRTEVAFVLVWPGADARRAFVRDASQRARGLRELVRGLVELVLYPAITVGAELAGFTALGPGARWIANLVAFVLLLDGACVALVGALRAAGFAADDLFREPWKLASLADFWGRRWNLFIARVLHDAVFVPALRRIGAPGAALATFVASGLFHEVIFALAAGGPYGRYTAFFVIQGIAMLTLDRRLPAGPARRAAAWVVLVASSPLFFNPSFTAIFGP